jgi:hypothetical protein
MVRMNVGEKSRIDEWVRRIYPHRNVPVDDHYDMGFFCIVNNSALPPDVQQVWI